MNKTTINKIRKHKANYIKLQNTIKEKYDKKEINATIYWSLSTDAFIDFRDSIATVILNSKDI
jgi:hypothetical protein